MDRKTLDMLTTPDELLEHALNEYESPLINYAATIVHDMDRAKDVVQDTFIRLYKQDVEKMKGGLKSWLYTVCRNRALDILRKEKRMISVGDEIFDNEASTESSPAQEALHHERVERVMAYMDRLSENQKNCILMKFQLGLSYSEISARTGLKQGNVGFLIHNGLKKLRDMIPQKENL